MAKYSLELREKALKLSDSIGVQKAADELNINVKTLNYWRGVLIVLEPSFRPEKKETN